MYASHVNPRMPGVRSLRVIPVRGNLLRVIDRVEQAHCSREGLPTQSIAHRWPIRGFVPSFSPEPANEAVGTKPNIYQRPTTRLTGPITPVCDRYVQYLITGTFHVPLPDLPDQLSSLSPSAPTRSPFNQVLTTRPKCWVLKNLWLPRGLSITQPSTVAYIYF
jgi:hypothetical protein